MSTTLMTLVKGDQVRFTARVTRDSAQGFDPRESVLDYYSSVAMAHGDQADIMTGFRLRIETWNHTEGSGK